MSRFYLVIILYGLTNMRILNLFLLIFEQTTPLSNDPYKTCQPHKVVCTITSLIYYLGEFSTNSQYLEKCHCQSKCNEVQYSAKLSTYVFPSKRLSEVRNFSKSKSFCRLIITLKIVLFNFHLSKIFKICWFYY